MRFLGPLLSLLAASPLALAAASTEDDKLQKISKLVSKSNNGLIQLTNALYTEITTAPRNYTAAILLTALDKKFGCALCAEFHPEYELLSKSWNKQHKNGDGLYFGVLDFERGRDTFMKVCDGIERVVRKGWAD